MANETPTKKSAGLRRRISYLIAMGLTAFIAGAVYHQAQLLPRRVSAYVNDHYLRGTNFEFTVDGVSGFFVRHLKLTNPTLRYHSESASYNVFRADEISVEYDLMPIFAFRLIVTDLTLRNVDIHLRQDADGKLVLPVLPGGEGGGKFDVSPVVTVRRFGIDGLAMKFGGNSRELAVRDVRLAGALDYADHKGHLIIDDGSAYLIDSKKTVSSIRMDARSDSSSVKLDDFAIRLDESFVIARGAFHEGRLRDVELIVNPISLPELHQLGLIGDEKGVFSGRASLDGPVDSLTVSGEISGTGLGVELSDMNFEGTVTPKRLHLDRMRGAVFGAQVDGRFDIDIETEDFVYDGQVANLDLGRGFIEDSDIPPMSLNGRAHVKHTKAAGRFEWEGNLTRGVIDGFEAFNVRAKGVYSDAKGMVIERAALERPGFKASGSGTVDPSDVVDVVFKVDATDLTYFWNHFKLPVVKGVTSLNGRIRGPIDDFTVNVNGPFHDLAFEPTQFDVGTVTAEARRIGTKMPEVTVALAADRGAISGQWFQSPVVSLEIDTSRVQIRNARFARGDTSFVADLDVRPHGKNATIDVRKVTITTPRDIWATERTSQIHVEPGALYVDSLTLVCPRGQLGGEGAIRPDARTLEFDAWGKGIDLAVLREMAKLPFQLTGTGNFKLGLSGPVDDPRGRLEVTINDGVVDSVAFDNLTARAEFDGRQYRVDHLQVVAGKDTVSANGTWLSDLSPVRIANKERPAELWDAGLSGRLRFAHFPLATVFRAAHRPSYVAAAYDGVIELGGTLEKPTIRARGRIRRAAGVGREVPPAMVDITYADGALRVADFSTTQAPELKLKGTFPLQISFHHGAKVNTDQPLEFRLDIVPQGDDPVELGRYIDGVGSLRGVLSGNVVGSGTPGRPRLSGNIAFTNGLLRFLDIDEEFKDIAMRVDFIDDVIRMTSLSARSGDKGSLVASGWARWSDYKPVDYKIDLNMREFEISSVTDIEIRTDGNLSMRKVVWRDGNAIPRITGKLAVKEAEIRMDITDTSGANSSGAEFTRPTDSPNWLASVDITADKNVWIKNPDLTVELEGDLILNRDERGLYFRGDMGILRGSYMVFGNKFEITDGTFDFSASETLRPSMVINAYTPYKDASASDISSDQNIYLSLTWPYDQKEPRIRLNYAGAPGYSEADVWTMLGRNNLGAGVATNALERVIDQQMAGGGFDVQVGQRAVTTDPSRGKTQQETVVGVGKYWQDIYFNYRRGLSTEGEQEVNVEYRLGRRFLLRSQLIYNSRRNSPLNSSAASDEYNVDLKYRFEF